MRFTHLSIAGVLVIAACARSVGAVNQDQELRGSYVWGAEVNTIKPCGSDSTFWVLGEPAVLARLRAAHDSLHRQPYDPIYVRIQGHRSTKPVDGFAEQTNGYFEVSTIAEIRRLQQGECQ